MVLYQAISSYQLLNFIIHKLNYKENEEATLMISKWLADKFPDYKKMLKYFNEIIVFDPMVGCEREIESYIIDEYFKKIFKQHSCNVEKFNEINVGGAHYNFGVYLEQNQVTFNFWEDAAGILSRPDILDSIDKNNHFKNRYCNEKGLYSGNITTVKEKVGNLKVQKEEFKAIAIKNFDVIEEYLKLAIDKQKEVKEFFIDIDKIFIPNDTTLILTQHFSNLKILTFEDHILIYQLLKDYFFENDEIVWKPHPDDLMYYSLLFPKDQVIKEKFPSEFLPIIFNNKPKTIATISSTAINNLYPYFDSIFTLDTRFEKDFNYIHRYWICCKLLEQLNTKLKLGSIIGINDILLEKIIDKININIEINKEEQILSKDYIYIIDDINLCSNLTVEDIIKLTQEISNNSVIIFINSKQDFCFYDINHKELWNSIVPVCINKKIIKNEELYASTEQEIIYFYSKNKEYLNMVENLKYDKELPNTGLNIHVDILTEEQKRIKILEGILEATEKRLLHYIKLVEEANK